MRTILIPVDLTATSENAVDYAAQWSRRYNYERIILLKSFYDSMFESIALSEGFMHVNAYMMDHERENVLQQLNDWCRIIAGKVPGIKIMTAVSEFPLLRAILEVIKTEKPELIVIGSDNYNYSADSFVSANLVSIAKASPVRVLVVPANYLYQPVKEALVPCDLDTVTLLDKVSLLRNNPYWQDVHLQILNVDLKEHIHWPAVALQEREKRLHEYLSNFNYVIHHEKADDVLSGIRQYLQQHEVQLIIALPGSHSFLYQLTHNSISEAIYRNAKQPVLILK